MIANGTRLGYYTITRPLGAGGMGVVYEAVDEQLKRRVAIKTLPARFADDADALQRFRREARAASALNHPNIVHIYAIDEARVEGERVDYIAMELIDGVTLRQFIEEGVSPSRLIEPITQVAEAVAKAHESGIAHCDLKPENIMIHRDGYAKVVDFGLARLQPKPNDGSPDTATQPLLPEAATVRGTAAYMSPEQVKGGQPDARSDVFTLGCILYEIASGRKAFEAGTVVESLWSILNTEPPPLTNVSAEWQRITRKCMEKDPARRYSSARGLAEDLQAMRRAGNAPDVVTAAPTPRRIQGIVLLAILIAAAIIAAWALRARRGHRELDSIAVLPFANVKHDPDLEYLSDGVTESVISSLSESAPLRVMSRASVFRFKDGKTTALDAGRALHVDAVLAGELEPHDDRLAISVELIDVSDGSQIWGHRYESEARSVLAMQQAISRDAVSHLLPRQTTRPMHSTTDDPDAYRLYLKGRYFWNKRNAEGLTKAADEFHAALDRDPSYARAWVGLADSYALMEQYAGVPSRDTCPKAKAAALRAIDIDPTLAEPHATLGLLYAHCEWNWTASEREFQRAIELNPNYATTHHWYALHLSYRRQFAHALEEARKAQELDPLSLIANNALTVVQAYAREDDAALEQCRKNLEMDPSFVVTYMWIGRAKRDQKKYGEAIEALQKAVRLSQGRSLEALADLGYTYAVAGKANEAHEILERLTKPPYEAASTPYHTATIYAGLGDKERALASLQQAVGNHSWFLVQINVDPAFDSLRGDPRFQEVATRIMR